MNILLFYIFIQSILLMNICNIRCEDISKKDINNEINKLDTDISIDDRTKEENKIKDNFKRTNNNDNSILKDDEFSFDDNFNEKFNFLQSERETNILDIIPISIGFYKEIANFNLYCIPKIDEQSVYKNKKFTLLDMSVNSFTILYKLRPIHNKFWNHFINKNPKNKFANYMKSHFMTSIGIFYENHTYYNYYDYRVEKADDSNIKKDITTYVGIKILRLGLLLKETWILNSSGKFNISLLFSFGWQTNIYPQKCLFHYKDTWLETSTDYKGFDKWGYVNHSNIVDVSLRNIFGLIQLDFGFYFIKMYVRFTSPIGKKERVENELNRNINNNAAAKKFKFLSKNGNMEINSGTKKDLLFNKWNISFGIGLAI